MSLVEGRELDRASPLRARSLLTVRAAISSARDRDAPLLRSLSLMCSYWRSRLLPFSTPRGGMSPTSVEQLVCHVRAHDRAHAPGLGADARTGHHRGSAARRAAPQGVE